MLPFTHTQNLLIPVTQAAQFSHGSTAYVWSSIISNLYSPEILNYGT